MLHRPITDYGLLVGLLVAGAQLGDHFVAGYAS